MKRTILLADDSPTIRRLVSQTFAGADFQVIEVSNGDAAIKQFDERQPSIVLADIYMPGKNGYEVCAYIRNHQKLHDTPVVLLVGAFDAFDEHVAKSSGATANITKPFEPGALIDLVNSLLPQTTEPESESETAAVPEPEAAAQPALEVVASQSPVESQGSEPVPAPALAGPASITPNGAAETDDLLGLETIFKKEPEEVVSVISDEDIDRIADRVIQRLSSQVIESIAWDIVPDITEKIVREELKRLDDS
jgi:CheY-like chemotaxis protein